MVSRPLSSKPRLLLFGGSGRLGKEILSQSSTVMYIDAPDHTECDIRDIASVRKTCKTARPDVVINAAAIVGAKEAETDKELTWAVNVQGAGNVAKVCNELHLRLVYISSAAIFDGQKGYYKESDCPTPTYYYAMTKAAAECSAAMVDNHAIVRVDMFPLDNFKYSTIYTDHYTSKIPMPQAAAKILWIATSPFVGVINVGGERKSLYDILKPYYPDIVPITLAESAIPDFPRDISLDLSLWDRLFGGEEPMYRREKR